MVRWSAAGAVLLLAGFLAGCSLENTGRKAIVDACLRGGQGEVVCSCLAKESARRLDKTMYDIVVLGAEGNASEADRVMAGLSAAQAQRFASDTRDIKRVCDAAAAPPATPAS